jgi:hypothetical protein
VLKLDHWLMRADIIQVEEDRPDLDHTIVRGLYENFVECHGRQPDRDEFGEYVDRITSSIEWLDLHNAFSRHRPTVEEAEALAQPTAQRAGGLARGRRGRPKGTRLTSPQQLVSSYRSLHARYGRPPSQTELASNLQPPIAKRTLQQHLREYGLPWPPA